MLRLEDEFSTLKVNWFPGHMVKATKIIREKLKQVCGLWPMQPLMMDRRVFLPGMMRMFFSPVISTPT